MTDPQPTVDVLLDAAVAAVGGTRRDGQHEMAGAVAQSIATGEHLLVQAGTGTGKSLAYLVPALLHDGPVIIATATIALQRQLYDRDLPRVVDALAPHVSRRPEFAIVKGRSNYVCLHRLNSAADVSDDDDALFDLTPTSRAGRDAVRIRDWASSTTTGDKDELSPAPDDRAWRSLSVTPHECLGAQKCPYAADCFAELARERAKHVDVVVTNHAMLAIDALSEATLLPEHDVVIIDEGHELADRATGAVTDELTPAMVERAARRAHKYAGDREADLLDEAAAALTRALLESPEGRIDRPTSALFDALVAVRDAGHSVLAAMGSDGKSADGDGAARIRARAAVDDVYEIAGRIVAAGDRDVVWITTSDRRGPTLWRAPLFVGGLLRETLFKEGTVILTSATLTLGGDFDAVARSVGLSGDDAPQWHGLDVGSPFDYGRQAILYVADHLPPPGRDGTAQAAMDELAELITAAGGRTLGLFSSMRAATAATEAMRERLDVAVLCQGDDATAALVRSFAADASTCLFGTLSLWQGVDVPGSACQLVVIDRLPFPRPDDPLASARQRSVTAAGGNGFVTVAVTAAALRLAQGAGRLIRSSDDRGVVAVLDSRLAHARYAPLIRASLPPMWATTDAHLVRQSLAAIDASAPAPLAVAAAPVAAGSSTDLDTAQADTERRGRRWSDDEHAALLRRFAEGAPPTLLADELGRSRGAVVTRLRQAGVTGRVVWGDGEETPKADRELAYLLAALPASVHANATALVDALEAEGWRAEPESDAVSARRGGVDAWVGLGDSNPLSVARATTSRWWLHPKPGGRPDCPAGLSGVIVAGTGAAVDLSVAVASAQ